MVIRLDFINFVLLQVYFCFEGINCVFLKNVLLFCVFPMFYNGFTILIKLFGGNEIIKEIYYFFKLILLLKYLKIYIPCSHYEPISQ